MPSNKHSNQVNLWEALSYLVKNWYWYIIGGAAGAVLGLLIFLLFPSKYEASVVIQPARIGSIMAGASASTAVQGNEPEPAPLMIERLKVPSFFVADIRERCGVPNESGYEKDMVSDLSANVIKLPNPTMQSLTMAKVVWKASSPDVARDCLFAIVDHLSLAQEEIIAPAVKALIEKRDVTRQQLSVYMSELESLRNIKTSGFSVKDTFNQIVIAEKAAQNLRESIAMVRKQLAEEEAQLSQPYTQPLTKLEPIYASIEPMVTLKLAISVGALVGMLLGVCLLLVRRSVCNYKAVMLP